MTNLFSDTSNEEENVEQSPALPEVQNPPRKLNMGNDKDRMEVFRALGAKALTDLYRDDPLVREGIDAQLAMERATKAQPKESANILRNEQGYVSGVSKSVATGIHATTKNQVDLLRAIRADVNKIYGVEEGK